MGKDPKPGKGGSAGRAGEAGASLIKSFLVEGRETPHVVELTPDQGSKVVRRALKPGSDVYLSISVDAFYHPEARKGLTKQMPLIFADAKWRRPTARDLPQTRVMGPNPEAHPNMAKHGNYAFGGRTFFGPERFDGSLDFSIGLHLFKSNAAVRQLIDVARIGSKLMPKGEMLVLGGLIDGGIDGALKGLRDMMGDKETPWIVGVVKSLAPTEAQPFRTGTWALVSGGGKAPEGLYLDRNDHLLRDASKAPLQKPYLVYSVDATETNPDRLRVGRIQEAYDRLLKARAQGEGVSNEQLVRLFQHFALEVELSEELTERDRDEIIAAEKRRFDRLMKRREAFSFEGSDEPYTERTGVSPVAVSAFRAEKDEDALAEDAEAAVAASLEALKAPDPEKLDDGLSDLVGQLHTAVKDYAALVRSDPETYAPKAIDLAKQLRRQREFKALFALGEQLRAGGVDIGWINYYTAAADIELNGAPGLEALAQAKAQTDEADPDGAMPVLGAMAGEAYLARAIELAGQGDKADYALLSDCFGLHGRIWKSRAVNAPKDHPQLAAAFERAESYHRQGLEATLKAPAKAQDPDYHRVNILAMAKAAADRGLALGKKGELKKWAQDILKRTRKNGVPDDQPWKWANAGEAALYLGRDAEAVDYFNIYLEKQKDYPFAIGGTRRQLVEVWGIDPKGNTDLADIVRQMVHLSLRSAATVSLSLNEVKAFADLQEEEVDRLEARFSGPPAVAVKAIHKVLRLSQLVGSVSRPDGVAVGTGFLLAGRHVHASLDGEYVFVTNDHVVSDKKTYRNIDGSRKNLRAAEARIKFEDFMPDRIFQVREIFWRSDSDTHDCAILRLFDPPTNPPAEFEIAKGLPPRWKTEYGRNDPNDERVAPRVFVIGHPNGRGLEVTFEKNYMVDHEWRNAAAPPPVDPVKIHYRAPTEGGNSGSPVLSAASQELIGLHHAQALSPLGGAKMGPGEVYEANEGLWIQSILMAAQAETANTPVAAAGGGGGGAAAPVASAPDPKPDPKPEPKPEPKPVPVAAPQPAPEPAPAPKPVASAQPPQPAPAPAGIPTPVGTRKPEFQVEDDEAIFDNVEGEANPEARSLEAASGTIGRFAELNPKPVAKWPGLADHPDTKHLAHIPVNLNNGMSFELTGQALRHALAIASTPVSEKWGGKVLFGIRGALPKASMSDDIPTRFVPLAAMREIEPNHIDYHCTMGVWDLATDEVFVCHGSTVPAVGYLWNSIHGRSGDSLGRGANMMAPGLYSHQVGTHANGSSSRQPGAFRQTAKLCVMRLGSEEIRFSNGNVRWDTGTDAGGINIWDNIHAGLVASKSWVAKHYSAGCQVVRGTVSTRDTRDTPAGHWRAFREAAGLSVDPEVSVQSGAIVSTPEDGRAFPYLLLTAREVRLAAENLDTPATDLKLFKLRRGSKGETVRALQQALGIGADGDFGYLTQRALIAKQLELTGEADGVVTAANAEALGLA